MNKRSIIAATLITLASTASAVEPENYIKYRQAVMKAIGGHQGASSQIVRGRLAPEGALAMHATALAALSNDLAGLFPEDSDFGETRAKDAVWDDRTAFEAAAEDARVATASFAEAVRSGDQAAIDEAFRGVGGACKGCHDDFRKEEDN